MKKTKRSNGAGCVWYTSPKRRPIIPATFGSCVVVAQQTYRHLDTISHIESRHLERGLVWRVLPWPAGTAQGAGIIVVRQDNELICANLRTGTQLISLIRNRQEATNSAGGGHILEGMLMVDNSDIHVRFRSQDGSNMWSVPISAGDEDQFPRASRVKEIKNKGVHNVESPQYYASNPAGVDTFRHDFTVHGGLFGSSARKHDPCGCQQWLRFVDMRYSGRALSFHPTGRDQCSERRSDFSCPGGIPFSTRGKLLRTVLRRSPGGCLHH